MKSYQAHHEQDTGREHGIGRSRRRAMLAGILAATALSAPPFAFPALAQGSDTATVDDGTIIVTAQRRSEALENVPATISVLTQETLANAGVTSLRDIQNVTTGVQLGQGGGFPQPAIRGVTTVINGTFENNVTVYVDGIYQPIPQIINVDLPNVQNIQVLKGPQGSLYGRNATGGVILLETINPGDVWEGRAELTYARFDDKRASAYVAGPLAEGVGVSLSGYIRRGDGYHKLASRTTPGEFSGRASPMEQDSVRAKLRLEPSANLRVTLGYNYLHINDPRGLIFTPYENVVPRYATDPGGGGLLPRNLGEVAYDIGISANSYQHEGLMNIELDTGIGTLKSVTGYSQFKGRTSFDFDGSYVPNSWSTSRQRSRTFQQSVDFNINAVDRLDLIVGGTYFLDKLKFIEPSTPYSVFVVPPGYDPANPLPLSGYTPLWDAFFEQKKEAWAAYADATFQATDQLSFTLGGRYSEERQNVFGAQPSALPNFVRPPTTASAKFSKFTPRAAIRFEVAPRTSLYASYTKGFRSGAYNSALPGFVPGSTTTLLPWIPAGQETIDSYEIGFKTAQNRFRFELAGFYYDYKNLQVSTTTTVAGANTPLVTITNAPSAEIYGVEGSFDFEIFENLKLRGGATWMRARYGDNFTFSGAGVDPNLPGINANSNPLKTFLNVSQIQDLSGLQMARAPDFTANAGLEYRIPQGDGGLQFAVNAKYTDSYVVTNPSVWGPLLNGTQYAESARKQRFREGNYVLLNASVTWTDPSDSYYLRIWGTNLTNHKYRLHYSGTNSWGTYAPMAEPLVYGATIGFKFREDAAPPPPPMAAAPPPPPPAAPPPPPQVVCNKGPYIVFFDWDRSDITPEAATILDSAIGAYANCDSVPIMLAGYTDRSGSAQYNMGLSERRNSSVRAYLTARGIADAAITSQAFGESNPRVPTADGVRELQNRRVEITYGPGSGF